MYEVRSTIWKLGGSAANGIKEPSRCIDLAKHAAASLLNPPVALKIPLRFRSASPAQRALAFKSYFVLRTSYIKNCCPAPDLRNRCRALFSFSFILPPHGENLFLPPIPSLNRCIDSALAAASRPNRRIASHNTIALAPHPLRR